MPVMIDLCIDARMAFSSGIGTCIREIVPFFQQGSFRLKLLVDQVGREWCKGFEQILFEAPIYSLKEQVLFPIKIPECDLFWSPHYNIPLLPIRAKKRIATIHDTCHLVFGSFLAKKYAQWVMKRALAKSDRILTVSQFSKQEIEKRIGRAHIEVIPNSVNQTWFVRKESSEELRKKYKLEKRFILFVGNHKPHKNLEGLVRAFKRANVAGVRLAIGGKGTAIGMIDDADLPGIYSMAEGFVFPSFYEGFGLPPLEAMSCGCPTAVSKAASIREVCGDASLYFDPKDEIQMAEAIRLLVADSALRKELVEKGYKQVQKFDWEKCAERHMEIFEEVCRA